jgi:hypothetical protein
VEFFDGEVGADVLFEFFLELLGGGFVLFHFVGGLLIDKHELSILHAELLFVLFELADFEFEEGDGFGEIFLVVGGLFVALFGKLQFALGVLGLDLELHDDLAKFVDRFCGLA